MRGGNFGMMEISPYGVIAVLTRLRTLVKRYRFYT